MIRSNLRASVHVLYVCACPRTRLLSLLACFNSRSGPGYSLDLPDLGGRSALTRSTVRVGTAAHDGAAVVVCVVQVGGVSLTRCGLASRLLKEYYRRSSNRAPMLQENR